MLKEIIVRLIIRALDRLTERTPEDAYQIVRRGCLRANVGDVEDAIADFSKAIGLIPTYGEAYRLRALAYLQMNELDSAMADIKEDLRLRPENSDTRSTYGDILRRMQQHREALRDYERSLELDSKSASGGPRQVKENPTFASYRGGDPITEGHSSTYGKVLRVYGGANLRPIIDRRHLVINKSAGKTRQCLTHFASVSTISASRRAVCRYAIA